MEGLRDKESRVHRHRNSSLTTGAADVKFPKLWNPQPPTNIGMTLGSASDSNNVSVPKQSGERNEALQSLQGNELGAILRGVADLKGG